MTTTMTGATYGPVPLAGSKKQIEWASTIRRRVLTSIRATCPVDTPDIMYRLMSLYAVPTATWWIVRRSVDAATILEQVPLMPVFRHVPRTAFHNASDALAWACSLLANERPGIILDTETTGLTGNVEIVDIAVIDTHGRILLNTRLRPTCPIPTDATAIHGITDAMVANAPTFSDVWPYLRGLLCHYPLTIYNAAYDTRVIRSLASHEQYPYPPINAHCAMLAYAAYRGERGMYGDFKWHKLTQAATDIGASIGTAHSALGDCQTTLNIIDAMSEIATDAVSRYDASTYDINEYGDNDYDIDGDIR